MKKKGWEEKHFMVFASSHNLEKCPTGTLLEPIYSNFRHILNGCGFG